MNWIHAAQGRVQWVQWWDLVNTVMTIQIS